MSKIDEPFKIGEKYFVRTVTMSCLGKLKLITQNELVFENAAWIADTGRFSNFLNGEYDDTLEVEPFPQDVILSRSSIIDATEWQNDLLMEQI